MLLRAVLLAWLLRSSAAARSPDVEEDDLDSDAPLVMAPFDKISPAPSSAQSRYAYAQALEAEPAAPQTFVQILFDIVGGTGAGVSMGNPKLDRDQLRRMRQQDKMIVIFMVAAYYITLAFSASLSYRQAVNQSPVMYYGDPRVLDAEVESNDEEDFLHAFNQPPKDVQLRVTGLEPIPMMVAGLVDNAVAVQSSYFRIAFTYGLDLSEWVVQGTPGGADEGQLSERDLEQLRHFLQEDANDLATVQIHKEISWPGWEELATNIKQKIRQCGFTGVVHVNVNHSQHLTVYKNKPWANFLHMRSTMTLSALSIVGYPIHVLYMWWRERGPQLHMQYFVDMDLDSYWQLVGHKITADGFEQRI